MCWMNSFWSSSRVYSLVLSLRNFWKEFSSLLFNVEKSQFIFDVLTIRPRAGLKTSWRLRRRRASRTCETFRTRWRVWRNIRHLRQKSWLMLTASVQSSRSECIHCRWCVYHIRISISIMVAWCYCLGNVIKRPCAGSGVVRIDPLRFLAGCRTRQLNQA